MKFTKRSQQGFALILVLLIGALMMIPVLMLLSAVAPRRASITGEAVSDIALASADGVVDRIATQINGFPGLLSKNTNITTGLGSLSDSPSMAKFAVGYLLSNYLNGGDYSTTNDYITNLSNIQKGVSTYLYDTKIQKYYAVWSTSLNHIKSVGAVGPTGDIKGASTLIRIRDLSTDPPVFSSGIAAIDPDWLTDNRWIEIDTNTQFDNGGTNDDAHSKFILRATAYPLSNVKIVRTVQTEISLGHIVASPGGFTEQATGAFTQAFWSGGDLTIPTSSPINGSIYAAGDLDIRNYNTITGDVQAVGNVTFDSGQKVNGNIYAGRDMTSNKVVVSGSIHSGGKVELNTSSQSTVGGNIEASTSIKVGDQAPWPLFLTNGQSGTYKLGNNIPMQTNVPYSQPPILAPTFDVTGAMNAAKTSALATGSVLSGDYATSDPNLRINVGGTGSPTISSYVGGRVSSSNSITFNLSPIAGGTVAWYVSGDVWVTGDVVLNFTSPCAIFVGGTFHCNALTVTGLGTVMANIIDIHGATTRPSNDTSSKVALIAGTSDLTSFNCAVNMPAVIYAPNGAVMLNTGGTITGSVVAKGGVSFGGAVNMTYDSSLTSLGHSPPIPGPPSISFSTSRIAKRSWRELVSSNSTVTLLNMGNTNPQVGGF